MSTLNKLPYRIQALFWEYRYNIASQKNCDLHNENQELIGRYKSLLEEVNQHLRKQSNE